ncbi:hypothetical protein LOCC1_G002871 [Lachnellula occidentalis]|uniref:Sulfatase N-terminal domain-containing protein n=1 Tax=Lachnellula occidentalis TaxID=215460 RepID=A0A8H8UJI4_9HELO|nr:hypothetical protein LOCC1_G002871 [Lachnellula occidentalis]
MGKSAFDIRHFWGPPFQYSLLVIAAAVPKLLHLYSHVTSLPPLLYLLYLPTFIALDVLNAVLFWILVQATAHGWLSAPLSLIRGVISLCIVGASSSWISFYLETGGEIKWGAAQNVAKDPAGLKVLMSGGVRALAVTSALVVAARLLSQPLYNGMERLIFTAVKSFTGLRLRSVTKEGFTDTSTCPERGINYHSLSSEEECLVIDNSEDDFPDVPNKYSRCSRWTTRIKFLKPAITVLILLLVRPRHFPFAHMSGSIPYTLVEIWTENADQVCQAGFSDDIPPFPLLELVDSDFWEPPKDRFPGWSPTGIPFDDQADRHLERPAWLPDEVVNGFGRWYNESDASVGAMDVDNSKGVNYNPSDDPLKISNLDQDLLESLSNTLRNNKVAIKHVLVLSLESTRKDVFPFKKDSYLYKQIMKSYSSGENRGKASTKFANFTRSAELLTGERSGFEERDLEFASARPGSWRNLGKDMGGLNVVGASTGSTSSLKSILGSHCGVQPLPVDFTVEVGRQIYQPCLPNILNLFNHNKKSHEKTPEPEIEGSESTNRKSMPWRSVYLQSITDQYDHQDELNKHLGFGEVIVKETLADPSSNHYPPTEKESNYFGYPETQLKLYLKDLFREAEEKHQRLFVSHLTGSTHHPWNTPAAFGKNIDYLRQSHWTSEHPLNRYLNTIKFADGWIGDIMDVLEEMDVADETLVVMVGDHGWAFKEDSPVRGTFENGHISNLRVPLLFHHPSLPRMQLELNATSMSIIPTILDLLTQTESLNEKDTEIASNLIHQYEGQSLIRPFVKERNGRQQWNVGVLNAGGAVLSVSSAAVPYRLILPVCKNGVYRFTDNSRDPHEQHPLEENSIEGLMKTVAKEYGTATTDGPAKWVMDAEKVGKWWGVEMRRRWRYRGAALQSDRKPEEMAGLGKVKKKHWWNN